MATITAPFLFEPVGSSSGGIEHNGFYQRRLPFPEVDNAVCRGWTYGVGYDGDVPPSTPQSEFYTLDDGGGDFITGYAYLLFNGTYDDTVISQARISYIRFMLGPYEELWRWTPGGMGQGQVTFSIEGDQVRWRAHWEVLELKQGSTYLVNQHGIFDFRYTGGSLSPTVTTQEARIVGISLPIGTGSGTITADAVVLRRSVDFTFPLSARELQMRWRDQHAQRTPWFPIHLRPKVAFTLENDGGNAITIDASGTQVIGDDHSYIVTYSHEVGEETHTESVWVKDLSDFMLEQSGDAAINVTVTAVTTFGCRDTLTKPISLIYAPPMIGVVARSDRMVLMAAQQVNGVEVSLMSGDVGGEGVLTTIPNSDCPSLYQVGGSYRLMTRDRTSGVFVRRQSDDGGRTWQ